MDGSISIRTGSLNGELDGANRTVRPELPRCLHGSFFSMERKNLFCCQRDGRFETDRNVPRLDNRRRIATHDDSHARSLMPRDDLSDPSTKRSFVDPLGDTLRVRPILQIQVHPEKTEEKPTIRIETFPPNRR